MKGVLSRDKNRGIAFNESADQMIEEGSTETYVRQAYVRDRNLADIRIKDKSDAEAIRRSTSVKLQSENERRIYVYGFTEDLFSRYETSR